MKRLAFAIFAAILAFALTACGSPGYENTVSAGLGIDVSGGTELSRTDDHGGFHGDGTTYIVYQFSDDGVLEQIEASGQWKAFPLDVTVQALVYGVSGETSTLGPYLKDSQGNTLMPEIENGYYLLIDRQAEDGKATGADILHRSSFNFTLGLYDTDTRTLHFCEYDT